jgi:hypothetical protein
MLNHNKSFDFNNLLLILNLFLCCFGVFVFIDTGGNRYVDANTIFLFCVFCAQNVLFLFYEKRKLDPFIIILVAFSTLFYVTRVITLMYEPFSYVLNRNENLYYYDLNYALLFIMFSNAAIFLGIACGERYIRSRNQNFENTKLVHPSWVVLIVFIGLSILCLVRLPENTLGRLGTFFTVFIVNLHLILLFLFVYLVLNFRNVSKIYKGIIISLLIVYVLFHTIVGSRSSLLWLLTFFFIAVLAIKGQIKLSSKLILMGALLIPVAIILFISATQLRVLQGNSTSVSLERANLIIKNRDKIFSKEKVILTGSRIFDRCGFLDYSVEAIAKKEEYKKVINFNYYFKSIVDNCLTPGFNVFDVPKVANALRYINYHLPTPTHSDVKKAYHADMITLYGDYYILFNGYFALIIFFMIAFLLKAAFNLVRNGDIYLYYLSKAVILYVFYLWINDFGVDWMFFDLMKILVTFSLFIFIYRIGIRGLFISKLNIINWFKIEQLTTNQIVTTETCPDVRTNPKQLCIVCKQELRVQSCETNVLIGAMFCGNKNCQRYGLITVIAFEEKEKSE